MSGHVFELSQPFEYKGATYTTMTARRPKVRDLRTFMKNLEKDNTTALEKVFVDLCEVDDKVIAEIDIEDFAPMKAWFEAFLKPMISDSEN